MSAEVQARHWEAAIKFYKMIDAEYRLLDQLAQALADTEQKGYEAAARSVTGWWSAKDPGNLRAEIDKLANFFLTEHPGWIVEGGAVDNAIRVIRCLTTQAIGDTEEKADRTSSITQATNGLMETKET